MKKLLTSLLCMMMVVCFMPSMAWANADTTCTGGETCRHEAAITKDGVTTHYDSLKDAVNAVTDSTEENIVTIDLLRDVTDGSGVSVVSGKNIIIDFHEHTYTVTHDLAGSASTKSQCFQLLKNSYITMMNGTIKAGNNGVAMLIQNYSNLTLSNMTLDGSTITRQDATTYALSNNNGEISLEEGTTITASSSANSFAMDVCWAGSYRDGARVTVNEGVIINGPIELGLWNQSVYSDEQSVLTINGGTINGEIKLDPTVSEEKKEATILELKKNVHFYGGAFSDSSALPYADVSKVVASLTSDADIMYYIGTSDEVAEILESKMKDGDSIEVQQGDLILNDISDNITVTAQNKIVVTFDNDGTKSYQTINSGATISEPEKPTKSGYSFLGWYNGDQLFDFNSTISANIILTAKWSKNVYIPPTPTTQKPVIEPNTDVTTSLSADGTTLTIKANDGYEITDVTVNGVSKGAVDKLTGLKTGDKVVIKTQKVEKPDDNAALIEAVKSFKLVARSANAKAPSGKKAIKVTWFAKDGSELNFDGYEIYRSTKKNSGYGTKPIYKTTKSLQYFNTSAKKGTRYYYKVRGYKMIGGEKVYTPYSLKAIRTAK